MSELAGAETWQPPTLRVIPQVDPEAEQARAIEEARERGYREGLQKGEAAGREQAQRQLAEMVALWDAMQQPFADMEDNIHSHLLGIACAVSEAVLRRELATDPDAVARALEQALATLGPIENPIEVTVGTADYDIMVGLLGESGIDGRVTADPNQLRGGCLIRAGKGLIDVRTETLIREAIAAIAGETRQVDDQGVETAAALSPDDIASIAERFNPNNTGTAQSNTGAAQEPNDDA